MSPDPGVRWCAVRGRRHIIGFYRVPTMVVIGGRVVSGEDITFYAADGDLLEVARAIKERVRMHGAAES